jgi:hypothetical protein
VLIMDLEVARPIADPFTRSTLAIAAEIIETDSGFTIDLIAKGAGLAAAPFSIVAALVKDSETISGSFPDIRAGDAVSGTGIEKDTTVKSVNAEWIGLSKAITADGTDIKLTITPPKGGAKLATIPLTLSQANDAQRGTLLEISAEVQSSGPVQTLGMASICIDQELTRSRAGGK